MEKKAIVLMGDRKFEAGKVKFCCLWPSEWRLACWRLSQGREASQIITRAREPTIILASSITTPPPPDTDTHTTPHRIHRLHPNNSHDRP